ncbi:MAG: GGDEF domain-containing protein [Myxococcaceae bacterium]|nr:GGDEF domain-containing protein [Myxococcaceae bacterium]MCA3010869.1 GGDEF domain-containing protein [Myxococcaceae bacterium]
MSRGLDIPTLLAAEAGSALMSALLMSVSPGVRGAPGAREAMLASWALALAFVLQLLRGTLPEPAAVLGANAAMLVGTGFVFESYRRFNDPSRTDRRSLKASVALVIVFAGLLATGASYTARAVFMSVSLFVFLFGGARELMRDDGVRREPSRLIGVSLTMLTGAALVLRVGLLLLGPPPDPDLLAPSLERSIAFFPATVMVQGVGLGFLVMLRDRGEAKALALATTDALTGCLNRRALEQQLERDLLLPPGQRPPLGVVLVDLDHFKAVNDGHGHATGDLVLKHTARVLQGAVRASDVVARLGGEEFCVVFRGADARRSAELADRLRLALATPVEGAPPSLRATASFGVTCFHPSRDEPWDSVFRRADEALYRAKALGRNRVEVAEPG